MLLISKKRSKTKQEDKKAKETKEKRICWN